MSVDHHRHRLCEEILGQRIGPDGDNVQINLPIRYQDITEDFLLAAEDAIYGYTPQDIRSVIPFVLEALQSNRMDLFGAGFFTIFFQHVCAEFHLPVEKLLGSPTKYSETFKQGWVSPTLLAMSQHELGWSFEWTRELSIDGAPGMRLLYEDDLKMCTRLLGMALNRPETACPALPR